MTTKDKELRYVKVEDLLPASTLAMIEVEHKKGTLTEDRLKQICRAHKTQLEEKDVDADYLAYALIYHYLNHKH